MITIYLLQVLGTLHVHVGIQIAQLQHEMPLNQHKKCMMCKGRKELSFESSQEITSS